jgi:hypothetical protein
MKSNQFNAADIANPFHQMSDYHWGAGVPQVFFDVDDDLSGGAPKSDSSIKPEVKPVIPAIDVDREKQDEQRIQERKRELEGATLPVLGEKVASLEGSVKKYREQLSTQRTENEQMKAALSAYQKLGAPDLLEKTLKEHGEFSTELEGVRFERKISKAANVSGYNPDALAEVAKLYKLNLEVATVKERFQKDGKEETREIEVVNVVEGEGKAAKVSSLSDYIAKSTTLKMFLPALQAKTDTSKQNSSSDPSGRGTFMPQTGSQSDPKTQGTNAAAKTLQRFKPKTT